MLFRKMLREMGKNFGQFFSILILAFLTVTLYTGLEGNVIGGKQARESFHEVVNLADGWMYGEGFTEDNLRAVQELDFIKEAQLRMSVTGTAPDQNGAQMDIYLATENQVNKPYLISGEEFDPEDTEGIWLASTFADAWDIQTGDELSVEYNGITFTKIVRGLVESGEYEYRKADTDVDTDFKNIAFVFMSYKAFPVRDYVNHLIENGTISAKSVAEETDLLEDTQTQLAQLGLTVEDITQDMLLQAVEKVDDEKLMKMMPYTQIIFTTEDGEALSHEEEIAEAIEQNYAVMVEADSVVGVDQLSDELTQHDAFSFTFSLIFLLIAVLVIATTMNRMVEKQRTQIGTMNAMGLKKSKIVMHYIGYSFVISLVGSLLGMVVGTFCVSKMMVDLFVQWYVVPGWKVGYDASYIAVIVCVVGVCTLSSYLSCNKVMKVKPAESLRPAPPKQGKHCIFEKLPCWNRLGFKAQYNLRDISRAKLRAVMGVLGTAVGMLLMVYAFSCGNLVDDMYVWSFEKIQDFQNELMLSGDITIEEAEDMKEELSGELVMMDQIEIAKQPHASSDEKSTQTITVIEGKGLYNITDEKTQIIQMEPGTVAISRRLAASMGVGVGDKVYWHIYMENDWHEAEIGVINRSPDTQGITYLRTDYEKTGNTFTPAILATNEDVSNYDNDKVTAVFTKEEMKEAFETSMSAMDIMVGIMIFFAVVMIVVVLYNSGNLSFHERIREFATLKVLGFQSSQIRSILTVQNLWLSIIGVIIGAPFGRVSLEVMMNSNGEQYDYMVTVTPQCYIISGFAVLVVSMLVSLMFSKRIKKLDMVDVLKGVE